MSVAQCDPAVNISYKCSDTYKQGKGQLWKKFVFKIKRPLF